MKAHRLRGLPEAVVKCIRGAVCYTNIDWDLPSDDERAFASERHKTRDIDDAEAVSSELEVTDLQGNALHVPMLDLDFEAAVLPSSTAGHSHLYLNRAITWDKYEALLIALAEAGLIEDGFLKGAQFRKATYLRLPWIRKGREADDRGLRTPEAVERFLAAPAAPAPDPTLPPVPF